jgi:hypothetical protein
MSSESRVGQSGRTKAELEPQNEPARALTLQLLEWLLDRPRTYSEVLDAWRTTCPRLSIWEDACIDGLIGCDQNADRRVVPSPKGQALLRAHRIGLTQASG